MARINDQQTTFVQRETFNSPPPQTFESWSEEVASEVNPKFYDLKITEEIVPRKEERTDSDFMNYEETVWDRERKIEITDRPMPGIDQPGFDDFPLVNQYPILPDPKGAKSRYQKKILRALYELVQNDFFIPMNLQYEKKKVCLGHSVVDQEIKRNANRKAKQLSKAYIRKYESSSSEFIKCVTKTTFKNSSKSKAKFYATGFHPENHEGCNHFNMQYFPIEKDGEITPASLEGQEVIKKCLGHSEMLYSFPNNADAKRALRLLSDSKIRQYCSEIDLRNNGEGSIKTQAFERLLPTGKTALDLYIFYQHENNHNGCNCGAYFPKAIFDYPSLLVSQEQQEREQKVRDSIEAIVKEVNKKFEEGAYEEYIKLYSNEELKENPAPYKQQEISEYELYMLQRRYGISDNSPALAKLKESFTPSQVTTVGSKKCEHGRTIFINGILNSHADALETAKAISEMQGGNEVDLSYNCSFGFEGDLIKQKHLESGLTITAVEVLHDNIMEYFENAPEGDILLINAHSQGGAVLKATLPDIPKEYRDRIHVDTYGTAAFIDKDMAAQVRNICHPHDIVPKIADKKGYEKAKEDGTLVLLEDDGKRGIDAHKALTAYQNSMRLNNKLFANGGL